MEKAFKAENIVISKLEDEGLKGAWQLVRFTSKNNKISKREAVNSMGKKKKRFVVERIWRPTAPKEWKDKPSEELEPDGRWHLLLLPPRKVVGI